jgi:colanic acid biosynthesis glycosyl transferase WcaI
MSKVLIVCQHFWPEAFRINDIANYFVEEKNQVDVLCGIPNYPKGEFFKGYSIFKKRRQVHGKVKIRRVYEVPRRSNTNTRIFLNYISFPFFSLFHIPELLTQKYDKILLYQLSPVMMSIAGIIIGKIKRIETTMYVLDLWPENLYSVINVKQTLLRKIISWISHWHYRNVDKIIVLSERMKTRIIEITQLPEERIIILPQACEKIYEKNIPSTKLISKYENQFNIVYTGNISPAQSFNTMLDAAEQLKSEGYKHLKWIIVGDGMSRKYIEKDVEKRGLENYFVFEGHKPIEDIPKYTYIADVLVGCLVKSDLLEATIPAKVMSYLASGKPTVLAMDGEVQDLINIKIKCGYAGPTEDAKTLANNIKKIYSLSKEERLDLGSKARTYHFEHFERNLILKKLSRFMFS